MRLNVTPEHIAKAERLVAEAHANDGLAPVDLGRFWDDQRVALADPFGDDIPQMPLGAICNWECVFEELGIPQQWARYQNDAEWRAEVGRAYNDKSERIVGRRLVEETVAVPPAASFPAVKELHDIFEMENRWDPISQTWWLHPSASSPDGLRALLDRVDHRLSDARAFLLPEGVGCTARCPGRGRRSPADLPWSTGPRDLRHFHARGPGPHLPDR